MLDNLLSTFDMRDINVFKIILNGLVSENIHDIRAAQIIVDDFIRRKELEFRKSDSARKEFRKEKVGVKKQRAVESERIKSEITGKKPVSRIECPSCGKTAAIFKTPSCQQTYREYPYTGACECGWSNIYKSIDGESI